MCMKWCCLNACVCSILLLCVLCRSRSASRWSNCRKRGIDGSVRTKRDTEGSERGHDDKRHDRYECTPAADNLSQWPEVNTFFWVLYLLCFYTVLFAPQLHHSRERWSCVSLWTADRLGESGRGWGGDEEERTQRHAAVTKLSSCLTPLTSGQFKGSTLLTDCVFSYRRRILGGDATQRERRTSSGSSER